MSKRIDLTGQRFGRLVVEGFAYTDKYKRAMWVCKCDCGKRITTLGVSLRRGETRSCGCLHNELLRNRSMKHGGRHTRLYRIWSDMIGRTELDSSPSYKNYGERGISICKEWRSDFEKFREWALDHGYKDSLTIDRINVNGDYCPENCRWTTMKIQNNRKRNNARITYKGKTMTLAQWGEMFDVRPGTLWNRINVLGWSIEEAFEIPVGQRRKK